MALQASTRNLSGFGHKAKMDGWVDGWLDVSASELVIKNTHTKTQLTFPRDGTIW